MTPPPRLPSRPVIRVVDICTQFQEETMHIETFKKNFLLISSSIEIIAHLDTLNGRPSIALQKRMSLKNSRQSL